MVRMNWTDRQQAKKNSLEELDISLRYLEKTDEYSESLRITLENFRKVIDVLQNEIDHKEERQIRFK